MNYSMSFFELDRYIRIYLSLISKYDGISPYKDEGRDLFYPDGSAYVLDMLPRTKQKHYAVTVAYESGDVIGSFILLRLPCSDYKNRKHWFYLATSILPSRGEVYQAVFRVLKVRFPNKLVSPVFYPIGSLEDLSKVIPSEDDGFYGFIVGANLRELEVGKILLRCPKCKKYRSANEFIIIEVGYPESEKVYAKMKIKKFFDEFLPEFSTYDGVVKIAICNSCFKRE